jgi:T-complex protein 1 subunit beta
MIPTTLADKAGWDSSYLVTNLRKRHFEGLDSGDKVKEGSKMGLDMEIGDIGDMGKLGITESCKLERQVVLGTSEAAEMILRRVDVSRPRLVTTYKLNSTCHAPEEGANVVSRRMNIIISWHY